MTRAPALLLLAGLLAVAPARAGTFSFIVENDLFADTDQHYTNGLRMVWAAGPDSRPPPWAMRLARAVPGFPDQGSPRWGWALGHSMFTPSDITLVEPPAGERPYAGWLYLTVAMAQVSGRRLDQVGITGGVVGPASMAEQSQRFVHRLIGSDTPRGWDSQLRNEPGLVLTWLRSWGSLASAELGPTTIDLTPHVGAALGNVFTYGNAGATVRWGNRLPADFGPPRVQPGLPGSGDFSPGEDFGWYLFAGIEGRAVARNLFLDGNTFRSGPSVDRRPFVGDLQAGIVLDWPRLRLSYTHVMRSREYEGQPANDDFGAFVAMVKF
ncbi:MAG: lipid A deacylase LpxR family protein [Pseudoxanthomonas sp.]|nr:lipid A deacylase LpxR family protein [Pseudoxanthomonas sp.]